MAVACADGPLLQRFAVEGVETHAVPISRSIAPFSNLRAALRLYRLIKAGEYDVVHVHTPVASVVGRVVAKAAGVPLVLYTAHGFYFHEYMGRVATLMHVLLERILGRWTDFLFTQSAEDAQTAVLRGIMSADRVETIGNGVPVESFGAIPESSAAHWRATLDIDKGALVVGTVGRLVKEKGYREFLQAARQVRASIPNAVFVVVGDVLKGDRDPFSASVADVLKDDPLLYESVRFTGFIEDVQSIIQLIDIFVLASYREGMPRSIIEAMAAGKPVVATDIRGCREEVVEGVTGYLVPVRDAVALANRIAALGTDSLSRQTMGQAGRARAEVLFQEKMVVDRLLARMDDLLAAHGLAPSRGPDSASEGAVGDALSRPQLKNQ